MTSSSRPAGPARAGRAAAALLLALAGSLLGIVALAVPASAQERLISITADGVSPKVLTLAAGDTVTFVNDDSSFSYRAQSTSDNWACDSGPVGLLPGRSFSCPDPFTESGTFTYEVAQDEPFRGSIVLPKPGGTSPAATPRASAAPGGPASPAAGASPQADASPSPTPTGGTGTARPPVTSGFDSLGIPSSPAPEGVAPAPAIAGLLPTTEDAPAPGVEVAPEATGGSADPSAQPAVAADLPGADSQRALGLAAVVAVVLTTGVVSLLVRLLLAEPSVRAAGPVVTVD